PGLLPRRHYERSVKGSGVAGVHHQGLSPGINGTGTNLVVSITRQRNHRQWFVSAKRIYQLKVFVIPPAYVYENDMIDIRTRDKIHQLLRVPLSFSRALN